MSRLSLSQWHSFVRPLSTPVAPGKKDALATKSSRSSAKATATRQTFVRYGRHWSWPESIFGCDTVFFFHLQLMVLSLIGIMVICVKPFYWDNGFLCVKPMGFSGLFCMDLLGFPRKSSNLERKPTWQVPFWILARCATRRQRAAMIPLKSSVAWQLMWSH